MWRGDVENIPATANVWDELNRWVLDDIAEMAEKRSRAEAEKALLKWAIKVVRNTYRSIYEHENRAKEMRNKYKKLEEWRRLIVLPAYRQLKEATKELREKVTLTRWNWKVYKRKEKEIRNNQKLVGETLKQLTNRILDLRFGSQVHKALATVEKNWVKDFLQEHGIKVWYEWVKNKEGKLEKVWKARIVNREKVEPILELFKDYSEVTSLNYCRKVYEEIEAF